MSSHKASSLDHSDSRHASMWYSMGLGFALFLGASVAVRQLISDVGDRADFNELPTRPPYFWFLAAYTFGMLCLVNVWLRVAFPRLRVHRVALVFASLGFVSEWAWVALARVGDIRQWQWTAWAADWLETPGQLLHRVFVGDFFCRWCDGLNDAPIRSVLLSVMLVSGFNAIVWATLLVAAIAVRHAFRYRSEIGANTTTPFTEPTT